MWSAAVVAGPMGAQHAIFAATIDLEAAVREKFVSRDDHHKQDSADLASCGDLWGIENGYRAFDGEQRRVAPETISRILEAMGATGDAAESPVVRNDGALSDQEVVVVDPQSNYDFGKNWRLILESGDEIGGSGELPVPLMPGYHELIHDNGNSTFVISSPRKCFEVDKRQWAWGLQLYALRSSRSWGIGDFDDLARFGSLARSQGAALVMVNPLHASGPGTKQEASPYFPSSREFRSPLFIAVDQVAGADQLEAAMFQRAKDLNATALIDRDAVWALKREALEFIWSNRAEVIKTDPAFFEYCEIEGGPLHSFATYCALAEEHGEDWTQWPQELRHPAAPGVDKASSALADRIAFHQWLQWLCSVQLGQAAQEIGIVTDLAVGASPTGADAWIWQDAILSGVTVGAPPDEFNTQGQNWSLPAFDPWKLRSTRFAPFIRMLRAGFSCGAGLRIDHVMGLFRLYCVPQGNDSRSGAYVRYPWREMLAIVAIESQRAGAFVVGEDLGTVERYMRDALQDHGILTYKVVWFEDRKPVDFPRESMASITTHDLPTIMGLLTKQDLQRQREFAMEPDERSNQAIIDKVTKWSGLELGHHVDADEAVLGMTKLLARASSAVRVMTVEDALGLAERPNYPGTTQATWPNWSVPLPVSLEELDSNQLFMNAGREMSLGG